MSEMVVLSDGAGNYFAFAAERLEAARSSDEDGPYYAVTPEEIAAAKVPGETLPELEAALGVSEVEGFGDPIPGIDVKLGKNPGGELYSSMGSVSMGSGMGGISPQGGGGTMGVAGFKPQGYR